MCLFVGFSFIHRAIGEINIMHAKLKNPKIGPRLPGLLGFFLCIFHGIVKLDLDEISVFILALLSCLICGLFYQFLIILRKAIFDAERF